ncbi:class I SAM-dependent methyltransferase [candidate division KSB1 bacterium]|nr:class I SAM-dependent methyltransferase [candidate division KSB1 bacterium]
MNEICCIFCETTSNQVIIEENGYKGKKCPECGLIYISPRPSYDEIVNLYGHDEAHIPAESHISNDFPKRLYARHHLRIIRSVVTNGAILEIGAGAGYFLDEARKLGFTPYGLELNTIQANFMRNELNISCEESPLSTSTFKGIKFDVVYHCDVISHFFDPISDFKRINEIMKDDSFLIFETGNFGEVDHIYFKHLQRFQYPDHLFFFSTDNLKRLLNGTGFKVLKMYRYSIIPQLMAMKLFAGIKDTLFKLEGQQGNSCDAEAVEDIQQSHFRSSKAVAIVRKIWNFFNYLLRYKIGAIAPKKCRPQTVIVIAQKNKAITGQ